MNAPVGLLIRNRSGVVDSMVVGVLPISKLRSRIGAPGQPGATAPTPDPGMVYRLAYALNETGDRAQALSLLEPILADRNVSFPERADAERLMGTLRGGAR